MTSRTQSPPIDELRQLFDEELVEVIKNKTVLPFSVDRILTDLIQAGVTTFDAINLLYAIKPYLKKGMSTNEISRTIYKGLQEAGYDEADIFLGTFLKPITIVFSDDDSRDFTYKEIKTLVKKSLTQFIYSSKTYRAVTDELHRIVRSIGSTQIRVETIEKMIPAALRNVIGVNPFSNTRCDEDYQKVIHLGNSITQLWNAVPDQEKPKIVFDFFESCFRVMLLSYEYLPGNSIPNTVHQVGQLVADISQNGDKILTDKEIYTIGKSAKNLNELFNFQKTGDWNNILEAEILSTLESVTNIIHGLMNRGAIIWLVLMDNSGNELFSKFASTESKRANRSLIAMAITGVQSIVNELTDSAIRQIEQVEGTIILFEKRKLFSILTMVKENSHLVRQKIEELAVFIEKNLTAEITGFLGSVTPFQKPLEDFLIDRFSTMFE